MTEPIEIEMSDDEYEEILNESYPPVSVCGYEHDSGSLLKRIDRIAFDLGKSEEESKWECSTCEKLHDKYDDAEECCKEDLEDEEDDND